MFAAVVGHCSGRATPSLRNAPPRQLREIFGRETIYRNRNAVQTNPATSQGLLRAGLLQERITRDAPRLDAAPKPARTPSPREPREAQPSRPRSQTPTASFNPALANLPTAEEIAERVRTQPIGRVLADICRDLGLYPAHPLWSELGLAINEFGGSWLRLAMDHLNQVAPIAHIAARLKAERAAASTGPPLPTAA